MIEFPPHTVRRLVFVGQLLSHDLICKGHVIPNRRGIVQREATSRLWLSQECTLRHFPPVIGIEHDVSLVLVRE